MVNAAAGADKESMQVTAPTSNGARMSAGDVLDALEKAWKESALVRERTITDTRELYRELEKGEKHGPLKRRIDALMFSPDGMRTAIEVKVDVADAGRESWAKIRPWMMVAHRFVYAVPAGLIDRPPVGADQRSGLVWVYPDGRVEWKRKCKINHSPEALPQLTVFNLAWRAAKGEVRSF